MTFDIVYGEPEIAALFAHLNEGAKLGTLDKDEKRFARKLFKAILLLSGNPMHPGLQSHHNAALSARYPERVFQSYLENHTPAAGRLFWAYGPAQRQITVVGVEPHPEDGKNGGYDRVRLSSMPTTAPQPALAPKDARVMRKRGSRGRR